MIVEFPVNVLLFNLWLLIWPHNPCGDGKSYTATNHCTNRGCLIGANVPTPSKEDLRAAWLNRFVH